MVIWMAPLAYLFVFAALGGVILLLRLIFRRQISLQTVAAVLGSWAAFGLVALLFDRRMHEIAVLLLTLGIGILFGRLVIRPRVRSYGESSTNTRSPGNTRMKCILILPETWASTS